MLTLAPRTGTLQFQQQGLVALLNVRVDATPMAVNLVTRKTSAADPTIGHFLETARRVVSQSHFSVPT